MLSFRRRGHRPISEIDSSLHQQMALLQIWITVFYGLKAMSQNSTQLWKSTANLESVSVQLVLDPLINSL